MLGMGPGVDNGSRVLLRTGSLGLFFFFSQRVVPFICTNDVGRKLTTSKERC